MPRVDLVATYLAALPDGGAEAAAEAFATGQTIGTWIDVPGITPEMRDEHGGRVSELRRTTDRERVAGESADGAWLLRVAFPVVNFGPGFPMLFTTLVGNDPSTSIAARLVDLELPSSFVAGFPGPGHGIGGWRRLTGVTDRPLLLNMIKPNTGFGPEVGAKLATEVAAGGVDLVKDDELLADPSFNRVAERAAAYRAALDRVASQTGHRARYVANVTTRGERLLATARAALEAGADAVMVNALAVGLDAVASLAEARLGVPIFGHTAGIETMTGGGRSGIGQAVLLGRLLRLAGADAILTSTPYARRPLDRFVYEATIRRLRDDWAGLRAVAPIVGGGLTSAHIPDLIVDLGADAIIGVGGAIQGHPDGATAGARAIRTAIDDAVAAVDAREAEADR